MKNILKNILLGGVAITMLAACNMDLVPTTSVEYEEGAPLFLTDNDVTQFQNGIWATYRALHSGSFSQSVEVMCDGFNAVLGFGNNYGSIHRTDESFTSSDQYSESLWSNHYGAIKNYNVVIAGAENEVPEALQSDVALLKGFALFCRASSYLTLARHFGNAYDESTAASDLCVPLVTKFDLYAKPERATVHEIYQQILKDLLEAEKLLQYLPGIPRAMYPTSDAVYALMARYYLDTKDYGNAVKYAQQVINSSAGYELSSDRSSMNTEFNYDSGSEPILQMYADLTEGAVYNTLYTNVSRDNDGKYFQAFFIPTQGLLDLYEPTDLRYTSWFSNSTYPLFVNGTRHEGITIFTKYIGNEYLTSGTVETGAHAAKPLMIGEMYLIAAEANARLGKTGDAKKILNALQGARNATLTSGTLENVKKEWFRETVGDGHRLACLKRWGDGFTGRKVQNGAENLIMTGAAYDGKSIQPGDNVLNWPVPAYELKLNPNLVQNPGY